LVDVPTAIWIIVVYLSSFPSPHLISDSKPDDICCCPVAGHRLSNRCPGNTYHLVLAGMWSRFPFSLPNLRAAIAAVVMYHALSISLKGLLLVKGERNNIP
jgi:hypothetical protein